MLSNEGKSFPDSVVESAVNFLTAELTVTSGGEEWYKLAKSLDIDGGADSKFA